MSNSPPPHPPGRRLSTARRCASVCRLFAQESLYYLFGYDGGGFVFFQCAIFPTDPAQPTALLCRKPDVAQAAHLFDLCEIWVNANGADPAQDLVKLLHSANVQPGAVLGLETDTYGLTGRNLSLLNDALSASGHAPPKGPPTIEGSHIVRQLRLVKSAAEIETMRKANELADAAIMAAYEAARPGILDSVAFLPRPLLALTTPDDTSRLRLRCARRWCPGRRTTR